MNTDSYIWYKKEAQAWTQCLPIGNGTLGAMIYGGVEKEVLAAFRELSVIVEALS